MKMLREMIAATDHQLDESVSHVLTNIVSSYAHKEVPSLLDASRLAYFLAGVQYLAVTLMKEKNQIPELAKSRNDVMKLMLGVSIDPTGKVSEQANKICEYGRIKNNAYSQKIYNLIKQNNEIVMQGQSCDVDFLNEIKKIRIQIEQAYNVANTLNKTQKRDMIPGMSGQPGVA